MITIGIFLELSSLPFLQPCLPTDTFLKTSLYFLWLCTHSTDTVFLEGTKIFCLPCLSICSFSSLFIFLGQYEASTTFFFKYSPPLFLLLSFFLHCLSGLYLLDLCLLCIIVVNSSPPISLIFIQHLFCSKIDFGSGGAM